MIDALLNSGIVGCSSFILASISGAPLDAAILMGVMGIGVSLLYFGMRHVINVVKKG